MSYKANIVRSKFRCLNCDYVFLQNIKYKDDESVFVTCGVCQSYKVVFESPSVVTSVKEIRRNKKELKRKSIENKLKKIRIDLANNLRLLGIDKDKRKALDSEIEKLIYGDGC